MLSELGVEFDVVDIDCEETYDLSMPVREVAKYLAEKKSNAYQPLQPGELLLTADTTVVLGNEILGKPEDRDDALAMLNRLSNNTHHVITGVCLRTTEKTIAFDESTEVHFSKIPLEAATYYVDNYKPYDKAGSYGIQEWIGENYIQKIIGSYHNVVGLPIRTLSNILRDNFNMLSS